MRNTLILTRTLLKSGGLFNGGNMGKRGRFLVPVLLGFAFLSFAFTIGMMTYGLYQALATVGLQTVLLPLAFGATSAVIFFFGIFYTISVMYHATDISLLLYMPLRSWQILAAKFITLVIYEYIFEAFILLPILVVYSVLAAVGPLFIIYAVLLALVTPVIALCIASVIIMVVMRFTRFAKNKQLFSYISGILALVIAVGFNILMQMGVRNMNVDPSALASLVPLFSRIFPGTGFAANALIESTSVMGFLNLLIYLVCCAAAVAVFLLLGQLLYYKGVAGVTESSAKRRAISSEELLKETEGAPVLLSYIKKEIRLLFRSPVAFLQCVLINLIWPFVMVVMLYSSNGSLDAVRQMVNSASPVTVLTILAGAGAFLSCANAVTSSAFSREGKGIYFMKYIPVPYKRQLMAKGLTGIILSAIGIVLLCAVALVFGADVLPVLGGLILGIALSVAGSVSGLLIDASRPKLEWSNEQQAIKQNVNVLLHMLVGLVIALAAILPVLLLHLPDVWAVLYIAVLAVVLGALLISGGKGAARRLAEMDV